MPDDRYEADWLLDACNAVADGAGDFCRTPKDVARVFVECLPKGTPDPTRLVALFAVALSAELARIDRMENG